MGFGGHVDFYCEQAVSVASEVGSGTLKAFAITWGERLAALPNVPTAREAGLNFQMSIWGGMFAPRGTPAEVIDKLAKAQDDPAVQKRLADLGGAVTAKADRTPVMFATLVKSEIDRWSPILKAANTEAK